MIIKEFRILIPMSVDEYQIGQLYTIQKKSRLESVGAGSGVEILENKPYESNEDKGQYTLKVYHVDERLPAGLKTVSKLLFPKSALHFEEESWNCYPHTRTKYSHKLFKSFNIDIESKYLNDYGQNDNVFNLTKNELSIRSVDFIDIVNDQINPNEYKLDEDPAKFYSIKTKRGPLNPNWAKELKLNANGKTTLINNTRTTYMCAYKLCRIECAFWGCQSRVEKLISESVLRHMILISHRQAWCWQDEYSDLSMDDVRKLEKETQRYLETKMKNQSSHFSNSDLVSTGSKDRKLSKDTIVDTSSIKDKITGKNLEKISNNDETITSNDLTNESINQVQEDETIIDYNFKTKRYSVKLSQIKSKSLSNESNYEDFPYNDYLIESSSQNDLLDNLNDNINKDHSLNSNLDEFYDAISQASVCFSTNQSETYSISSMNIGSIKEADNDQLNLNVKKQYQNKIELLLELNNEKKLPDSPSSIDSQVSAKESLSKSFNKKTTTHILKKNKSLQSSLNDANQNSYSKIDTLILVIHGGNVTCTDTSKINDFSNFKSTMEAMIKINYSNLYGHIAYRLVKCDPICKEALIKLSALSPVANEKIFPMNETDDFSETSAAIFSLNENLPFNTLPILALANQKQYRAGLGKFTKECNKVYQDFLNSNEGKFFQGQVVMIGDSLGSIFAYDSLCQTSLTFQNTEDSPMQNSSSSSIILANQLPTNTVACTNNMQDAKLLSIPSQVDQIRNKENNNPIVSINDVDNMNNENKNSNSNIFLKRISSTVSAMSGMECPLTPQSPNISLHLNNNVLAIDEKLDFDVSHFFVFGSPLGLVLAFRKMANTKIDIPCCSQIYNMFHLTDPSAIRIEPLLCKQFAFIEPCMIPRYSKFPLGDGSNISLDHFILKYGHLFENSKSQAPNDLDDKKLTLDVSNLYLTPNFEHLRQLQKMIQTKKQWWGENRIDYVLYAPDTIVNLPRKSLPYIFHSCYWESTDVISFILRIINKSDPFNLCTPEANMIVNNSEPVEKWQKRLNRVKLRNLSSNHRANDMIVLEDREQILNAKFSYGPLDFALSGEKVDIYITKPTNGEESQYYATETTDSHGKIRFKLPVEKRLPLGIYQVKMIVKCDRTFVEFFMAVLPSNTEIVVFSIDGSFAANISFSGHDPKVRAGAVDVVRHWQDLGYLIVYITARPDIQHYKVTNWLAQHNFPLGMVFFSDGISTDPIRQKTETLKNITVNCNLKIHAAYGSAKDIPMYSSLGVSPNKIFIVGKIKTKYQNQAIELKDGYASHLGILQNPNTGSRNASGNARLFLKKDTFNIRMNSVFSSPSTNNTNTNQSNNNNSISNTNSNYYENSNSEGASETSITFKESPLIKNECTSNFFFKQRQSQSNNELTVKTAKSKYSK